MARPSILNALERKFILLFGDLLIVITSLNVFVNHAIDKEYISLSLKTWLFTIGILVYLSLSYILEFYNLEKVARRRYVLSQSLYISLLYVFVIFFITVLFFDASFWRKPLLYFIILTPIQIGLWRLFFGNVFRIIPVTKHVLYIYDKKTALTLRDDVNRINGEDMESFYRVKLTFSLENTQTLDKEYFQNAAEKTDVWIINVRSYEVIPPVLEQMLLNAMNKGKEVISFTAFYENTYEALPVRSHGHSLYEILQLRTRRIRYLQKIFSFGVNTLCVLFVGSILLFCIPLVWFLNLFFNKGPLFYVQERIGQHGKPFKIYKFRSMVIDAEKSGATMASKNDKRITPLGRILRTFRIDELPQIISVIQGHMVFIGPRPEREVFVNKLIERVPFYDVRHLVKPGITGWAQVKYKYGENLEDSVRKLEYDLYYIKNHSITLDLRIIFKTITTILFSRGI